MNNNQTNQRELENKLPREDILFIAEYQLLLNRWGERVARFEKEVERILKKEP